MRAPRDPAWTADGIVSDEWEPVSPVTGQLDAFEWKVPVASNSRPQVTPSPAAAAPPALLPAEQSLPLARAENAQ